MDELASFNKGCKSNEVVAEYKTLGILTIEVPLKVYSVENYQTSLGKCHKIIYEIAAESGRYFSFCNNDCAEVSPVFEKMVKTKRDAGEPYFGLPYYDNRKRKVGMLEWNVEIYEHWMRGLVLPRHLSKSIFEEPETVEPVGPSCGGGAVEVGGEIGAAVVPVAGCSSVMMHNSAVGGGDSGDNRIVVENVMSEDEFEDCRTDTGLEKESEDNSLKRGSGDMSNEERKPKRNKRTK